PASPCLLVSFVTRLPPGSTLFPYTTLFRSGDGSTSDRASPVAVVADQRFTQVSATGGHTCATSTNGAAYCWGYNVQGQLGDGTRSEEHTSELQSRENLVCRLLLEKKKHRYR